MKYRKKSHAIEAVQFTRENRDRAFNFCSTRAEAAVDSDGNPVLLVDTLNGTVKVNLGDWIIRGVSGEFYRCSPDIFEKTYEPAEVKELVEKEKKGVEMMEMPQYIQDKLYEWACELRRPSVLFGPKIAKDGNVWCALLGDNLQVGVAGFGKTPEEAFRNFDTAFTFEEQKCRRD